MNTNNTAIIALENQRNMTQDIEKRQEAYLKGMGVSLSPQRLEIGIASRKTLSRILPESSGVYFLFDCAIDFQNIAYVGITENIKARWMGNHHILPRITKSSVLRWALMSKQDARNVEMRLTDCLSSLRPVLNQRR